MADGDDPDDPVERLLDLFLYAPIGLLASAGDDLDEYVRKGRERAVAARMVGEFALRGVDERVGRSMNDLEGLVREFVSVVAAAASPAARRGSAQPARTADGAPRDGIDDLIDGYDSLTARDVVQRLGGLDDAALTRIEGYESSHRNRSTVLNAVRSRLR